MTKKSRAEAFVNEGYNITVTGRNVLVTDAMKDYAIEKISKIERFSPRLIDVVVTMDIQRNQQRVDIKLQFNAEKIKSHAITDDMYASIDKAVDKLEEQIRRYKGKIVDLHKRTSLKDVDMNVNVVQPHREDDLNELNLEIEEENNNTLVKHYKPHAVVSQETKPLKTLTLDEAILKMELSQDTFLIYRSEEDRKIKVIYRRKDNNYGVFEPES